MVKAVALFALLAPLGANAHYIFNRLIVNGASIGGEYAYTRKNSNSYNPAFTNDIVNSNDLRCNKGAQPGNTATYTVKAGDTIGFKLFNNEFIEHPGPGFVYISKAPSDVKSYDGSGDWTKVMQSGLNNPSQPGVDTAWANWQKDRLEWKIQQSIPAGEYLVRVEHIGLHEGHVGKAQFYIECFQLKIESSGTGKLSPTVKFPGAYKTNDPGIAFNKWNNPKERLDYPNSNYKITDLPTELHLPRPRCLQRLVDSSIDHRGGVKERRRTELFGLQIFCSASLAGTQQFLFLVSITNTTCIGLGPEKPLSHRASSSACHD